MITIIAVQYNIQEHGGVRPDVNRNRVYFFLIFLLNQEHGGMAGVRKPTSMACTMYITQTSTTSGAIGSLSIP